MPFRKKCIRFRFINRVFPRREIGRIISMEFFRKREIPDFDFIFHIDRLGQLICGKRNRAGVFSRRSIRECLVGLWS